MKIYKICEPLPEDDVLALSSDGCWIGKLEKNGEDVVVSGEKVTHFMHLPRVGIDYKPPEKMSEYRHPSVEVVVTLNGETFVEDVTYKPGFDYQMTIRNTSFDIKDGEISILI